MSPLTNHVNLEIAYLVCGTLVVIFSLILGKNSANQKLYLVSCAIGGIIAVMAIASLLSVKSGATGWELAISRTEQKVAENKQETNAVKQLTEDLKVKTADLIRFNEMLSSQNVALKTQAERADTLAKLVQSAVKERTESEAKLNGRLLFAERKLSGVESKVSELATKSGVTPPAAYMSTNTAIVQINTTEAQLDRARRLRDRLAREGMNATVLPTQFDDMAQSFDPGTVNVVYIPTEEKQAIQVKQIIDQANYTKNVTYFRQGELKYAPIQVNLW